MSSEVESKRPKWVAWLIVLLPAWLVASGAFAIWHRVKADRDPARETPVLLAQEVSTAAVADDLRKLTDLLGERHGGDETAARSLTRTARWIEGSLGPGNIGHKVGRIRGPAEWPLLHAVQPGTDPKQPAQWLVAGYDCRPGSTGVEANSTGVASLFAACRALAGETTKATIHYLFLPHVHDPDSPVLETASLAAEQIRSHGNPGRVMVTEAMGSGTPLWISSRDMSVVPDALTEGIAEIKGAEVVCLGDDFDLASVLFEMGLPAVRVATRPIVTADEDDSAPADPRRVAAAAGSLVQWIRRCAENP